MRNFLLALALVASPLTLTACQSEEADAVEDAYDAEAEALDAQGLDAQADAMEEAGDAAADSVDEMMEDTAAPGDAADVVGDGEIIDEPGEPDADAAGR